MNDCKMISRSGCEDKSWFGEAFSELPGRVREGRYRIGIMPREVGEKFLILAPEGNSEFWLALEGETVVGRVGANLLSTQPGLGAIGFFEVDLLIENSKEVGRLLILSAENYLRSKGVRKVVGPMNFNTWFPYRFRIDDDSEALSWEPNNPLEYPDIFRHSLYQEGQNYHSFCTKGLERLAEKTEKNLVAVQAKGFGYRPFDAGYLLSKEVPILYELSMEGFRGNHLFEPIPFEAFRELYVPLAKKMDFSLCFFALDPEGREAGFFFAFVEKDSLILKSATILPRFQGLGLSNMLCHLIAKQGLSRGVDKYVSALVQSGNRSESYSKKGDMVWVHQYVLMEKGLG